MLLTDARLQLLVQQTGPLLTQRSIARPLLAKQGLFLAAATAWQTLTPHMNVSTHQRKPLLLYPKFHGVLRAQVASATLDHQDPRWMLWSYVGSSTGREVTSATIATAGMPTFAQSAGQALTQLPNVANTAHPGPLTPPLALSHHGVGLGDLHLLSSDLRHAVCSLLFAQAIYVCIYLSLYIQSINCSCHVLLYVLIVDCCACLNTSLLCALAEY